MMGFWCCLYILWVHGLGLPYPVPLVGLPNASLAISVICVVIWYIFPPSWRKIGAFKKQAKFMFAAQLLIVLWVIEYCFFTWVFYAIPKHFQWTLALVLPFAREAGAYILTRILQRTSSGPHTSGNILAAHLGFS